MLLALLRLTSDAATCVPTQEDTLGPFYRPGAPVRQAVGTGYVLQGTVRSAKDCAPLAGAVVELWLAGPDGGYDDAHRATITAGADGSYRFESNYPPHYFGRPPHIHLRVSAKGLKTLVTQHYPEKRAKHAVFDVVLVPEK
jgi:protocatechuate 3,4-dioxygenase beta subunit